ncbi:MAG: bifunctional folylpolyglutamate synthase/dihydrofolate synthase [Lachnospiraceae bacterium]
MKYQETMEYIQKTKEIGYILGLDSMRALLSRLGNPQDALTVIHAAGTNGKGSVLAYLSTALRKGGYKTGKFTSPGVFSYLESFEINGEAIAKEAYAALITTVKATVDAMCADGLRHPTTFEIETAAAFLCFYTQKCDIVLLETGMGGLTDATNIVQNTRVEILTSIGMDHMEYLGDTLEDITRMKAGIIKPHSLVVSAVQSPEAAQVIADTCRKQEARLYIADAAQVRILQESAAGQTFVYKGATYTLQMAGTFQIENAVLAIETLLLLKADGLHLTLEQIQEGLLQTKWLGRFMLMQTQPDIILDGAHNPPAALHLKESLLRYYKGRDFVFVMSMLKDKNYDEVAEIMAPLARQVITVTPPNPGRALEAGQLAEAVRPFNPHVQAGDSVEEAVELACSGADTQDVIVVFGTLSFLNTVKKVLENKRRT